eukprot:6296022-Ditylum_brightwellii.AAC.1
MIIQNGHISNAISPTDTEKVDEEDIVQSAQYATPRRLEKRVEGEDSRATTPHETMQVDKMQLEADNLYIGEDRPTEAGIVFGYDLYSSDVIARLLTDWKQSARAHDRLNTCMVDVLALPMAATRIVNG